ncbi:MAG: hypothetical protein GY788_07455 [bacterium]|nr:hypothetical protein [bacterium]
MVKWLKDKLGITALEEENKRLREVVQAHGNFVSEKIAELQEYTRVDADIGFRGNNTIILTGVYRNRAYVQFYDLEDGEFRDLVEHLKDKKDHALIRNIDAPLAFRGMFEI